MNDPSGALRKTITVSEMAMQLGIGRNSAYEAIRRGDVPSIRIGNRIVVPIAALDRLLGAGNEPVE